MPVWTSGTRTLTSEDMEEGGTTLPATARVISLLPSATDTVVALQAAHLLVGRSHEVQCALLHTHPNQTVGM